MEPAVLGRMCAGGDYDETVDKCAMKERCYDIELGGNVDTDV
jgi:hypothetical protein